MSTINLGGGVQGISTKQTINNARDGSDSLSRKVLRSAWNGAYATGTYNGSNCAIGGFKAVNNIGDFLNRKNYVCNIPNPNQPNKVAWRSRIGGMQNVCDDTGVPCSNSNNKFVPDASDYTKYRRQRTFNQLYNDASLVGDDSNGSYVAVMAIRRF